MSDDYKTKIKEQLGGVAVAGRAMNLARMDKQNALVRRLVRKLQDGKLGQESDMSDEEDDTNINIGDQVYQLPTEVLKDSKKTGWLVPTIAAAALGLGGLGAGLGLSGLMTDKSDKPVINLPEDRDTDTKYDIGFFEPVESSSPQ